MNFFGAEAMIQILLGLPALAILLVLLTGKFPNIREGCTLVIASLLFLFNCNLATYVFDGERPGWNLGQMMPGFELAFSVEPLGMLFALVASGLWVLTTVYAIGYMRGHHEKNQTRFFMCFAAAIFAAMAAAFSANLFTLFVMYEVMTISTYPLVTHHGDEKAKRGGRVYLGILLSTSVAFFMFAVAWTWKISDTLTFTQGGVLSEAFSAGRVSEFELAILLGLFAFGIGKAALMPFHRWLPSAMVAPTPVSALLHAVAVVKVGVFSVLKVAIYIFGLDLIRDTGAGEWLCYVAGATILLASLVAMTKDNLKARLAYSTISQLAYITLGAMIATPESALGGSMHIAMHAVAKITLFFCAGAIYVGAHKTDISQMRGLGRAMPFTFAAFLIASISIIGLPPSGGSWSKWLLALGAAETGHVFLVATLMISSLLNIAYLIPIPVLAFMVPKGEQAMPFKEGPMLCVIPLCITAVVSILSFFFANSMYECLLPIVQ